MTETPTRTPVEGYVALHVHTSGSLLDGIGQPEDYVARAVELGQKAMSVTDHGSLIAVPAMRKACMEAGIKPILGQEFYLAIGSRFDPGETRADALGGEGQKTKFYEHITLVAQTPAGWRNIVRMTNESWKTTTRNKYPLIDYELMDECSEGVICLTGCLGGPVLSQAARGRMDLAEERLRDLVDIFTPERTFVEVMHHGIPEEDAVVYDVMMMAASNGIRCVATADCHYVHPQQSDVHEAWLAKQRRVKLADKDRWTFHGSGYYLQSEDEVRALDKSSAWQQAVSNTAVVASMIDDDVLPPPRMRLPVPPVPERYSSSPEPETAWLMDLVLEGARERGLLNPDGSMPPEVAERLNSELIVFRRLKMVGYALLVAEFIKWAKSSGINVGPGRGSAAGSLILYCLGITGVNPLEEGTLFERFLDPEREGMPDVDTDFERGRRDEVYRHLVELYGDSNVVRLGTLQVSKTKASIKTACSQLGISDTMANKLTKTIPDGVCLADLDGEAGEQFRMVLEAIDSDLQSVLAVASVMQDRKPSEAVMHLARSFENVPSTWSIHACGVIVSPDDLMDLVPMRVDKDTGEWVTQWDGPTCEAMGLVKIDLLGLRNLDVISHTCAYAGIDLDSIPSGRDVDEKDAVWQMLGRGDTASVFQLESGGMADLCTRLSPRSPDDLTALGALYRPGPMGTGMHLEDADRRNGRERVSYSSYTSDPREIEVLDSVLGPTYGVAAYQETLMKLGGVVAGFSASDTNLLRKAVAKKKADLIAKTGKAFVEGAVKDVDSKGNPKVAFSRETAMRLWAAIESAGRYAFNLSHAVAYGRITFTTAWLKAHYPAAYGAGTLAETDDEARRGAVMRWLVARGVQVLAPDVNRGQADTSVPDESTIILGLGEIKDVGAPAAGIVAARPEGGYTSVAHLCACYREHTGSKMPARALEAMAKAGALDVFGPRAAIVACARALAAGDDPELPGIEYDPYTRALVQRSVLGTATGQDVMSLEQVEQAVLRTGVEMDERVSRLATSEDAESGEILVVAGVIASKETKTSETWRLASLVLADGPHRLEVTCWRKVHDKAATLIPGQVVVVRGRMKSESFTTTSQGADGEDSQVEVTRSVLNALDVRAVGLSPALVRTEPEPRKSAMGALKAIGCTPAW